MKRSIVQPISLPCKLLLYVLCGVLVTATVGCRRSTPFPPDTVPRFAQTVAEFTFKVGQPVALILPAASGGEEPLAYHLEQPPAGLAFAADTRTEASSGHAFPRSSARSGASVLLFTAVSVAAALVYPAGIVRVFESNV